MKKVILSSLLILISFVGYSQEWFNNFDKAITTAKNENKNIVMVFAGSDWCAPCIKLEKYILESDDFKNYAKDHWVLLKLDFPKKKKNKLSDEQQLHNDNLAEKYNRKGYFPLVVLLDKNGSVLGETGYKKVTSQEYINDLISLEK